NSPRGKIQKRTDTNRNDAKLFEIAFRPQLLTRLAHSNQDQARSRGRDGLPDRLLLITGKYPERWPTTRSADSALRSCQRLCGRSIRLHRGGISACRGPAARAAWDQVSAVEI